MKKCIALLWVFVCLWSTQAISGTWVNYAGTWKVPVQEWVNSAGEWKSVQEQWINNSGSWELVYSPSTDGLRITFTWQLDASVLATTSGFTVYMNASPLCAIEDGSATSMTCITTDPLVGDAEFYLTRTDTAEGESGPSNSITYTAGD